MPIRASDRYYRAEVVPESVRSLGRSLCNVYGRPAEAFGAKGNLWHPSGYHRSRAWVLRSPDSKYKGRDYSVLHSLDSGGDENLVSAFDFTPGAWGSRANRTAMITLTQRMYAAAKARDPRLSGMREFAGTLDGKTVITFNCADGSLKSPFDSSHLDHVHGSLWRRCAANDHSGVLAVMLGRPLHVSPSASKGTDMILARVDGNPGVYLLSGRGNSVNVNEAQRDALKSAGVPFLDGTIDQATFNILRDWDSATQAPSGPSITAEQLDALAEKLAGRVSGVIHAGKYSVTIAPAQ